MTALPLEGGCQCGAVRYRITAEPVFLSICACGACRKQSGSAFGMSLRVGRNDLDLTGELRTWSRPGDSGASVDCCFCPTCGTRIFHAPASAADFVHIKPGTLDTPDAVAPQYMSYTDNAPGWVHVDGLDIVWSGRPDPAQRTGRKPSAQ